MAEETKTGGAIPTLEDWQHWTLVIGRAQQMLMEFWADSLKKDQPFPAWSPPAFDGLIASTKLRVAKRNLSLVAASRPSISSTLPSSWSDTRK